MKSEKERELAIRGRKEGGGAGEEPKHTTVRKLEPL
jgi:hypothetical protein